MSLHYILCLFFFCWYCRTGQCTTVSRRGQRRVLMSTHQTCTFQVSQQHMTADTLTLKQNDCTVLLNGKIRSSESSTRRAMRSPRPVNTGLRNGARRRLDSHDQISLSSTVDTIEALHVAKTKTCASRTLQCM